MQNSNQSLTQSVSQSEASLHAIDYWQVFKNRYGVIILTFLLVVMVAGVITAVMPEKYESTALVQVVPISKVNPMGGPSGVGIGMSMTRQFMNTQFEIIVARETLELAIDKIQLEKRWKKDRETILKMLHEMVKTRQRRGTDMIEISVRHEKKEDAQAVCQAVYEAYEQRRNELESSVRKSQLEAMKLELRDKRDRVARLRSHLRDVAKKSGIIYIETEKGDKTVGFNSGLVETAEKKLFEFQQKKSDLTIQIKKLLSLNRKQMIAAAPELPDVGLREYYNKYVEAKRDLDSALAGGLGPNHPDILAKKKNIKELELTIERRVISARESLKLKLALVEDRVKEMQEMLNNKKEEGAITADAIQEFNMARKDYQNAQRSKESLEREYDREKAKLGMPAPDIIVHEKPTVSDTPVSPDVSLNMALGAVVGLIFGIGIAFALEYLDTSIKSLEDVERYLKVPVLAVIPQDVGVLHKESSSSPDAEAYRILRTNIEFNRKNADDNAITVVSGGAGEGKSTTMVNLAYICAQAGYTVLMIDADLRRPRLHTFFDVSNSVGLTNYLSSDQMLEDVILKTEVENLYFMPSGILPADASGILNSRRMSELLKDVKQRFDLVLVDSPPILGVSDASVLASEVDLTMIVVQHRKLPRKMLMRVKQAVENVGGHVLGVVLNNVDIRSDSQYQYYTSYYTYYAPTEDELPVEQNSKESVAVSVAKKDQDDELY